MKLKLKFSVSVALAPFSGVNWLMRLDTLLDSTESSTGQRCTIWIYRHVNWGLERQSHMGGKGQVALDPRIFWLHSQLCQHGKAQATELAALTADPTWFNWTTNYSIIVKESWPTYSTAKKSLFWPPRPSALTTGQVQERLWLMKGSA